jgi:putative ABC transport system permease protein
MPFLEALRLAVAQIRSQKLKSFFTLAGVTIGVMFLIAIVSIVEGMGRYIEHDFIGKMIVKNSFVLRQRPNFEAGDVDDAEARSWRGRPPIDEDDVAPLAAALPSDARFAAQRFGTLEIASPFAKPRHAMTHAVGAEWFAIKSMDVSAGRLFTPQEDAAGANVVVIGEDVRTRFFPNLDPVGRELRIANIPYTIIGVAETQGTMFGRSMDQFVVIPLRSPAHSRITRGRELTDITVQAPSELAMRGAMESVRQVMRTRHKLRPAQPDDFALETSDAALDFLHKIQGILIWAGVALPAIGLIVGAIVIMNIMLVAVAERTREIGIRKALGARRRDILSQFLVESTTLATLGAALGIACGALLAMLIAKLSPLPASVAFWSVIVAVVVGAGVGIVSGVYPASRAARLDPITALRQE